MYSRLFAPPPRESFFLFGPRGTGKSSWLRATYSKANYIDLLDSEIFNTLHANYKALMDFVPKEKEPVIIDEVQKIPGLLDEVHRHMSLKGLQFILTGSSARKLRRQGVNLLAGRAYTYNFHPLTAAELGNDFDIKKGLQLGGLPAAMTSDSPEKYLQSYVTTYLKEEVQQEGLTRNMPAFHRFLQAASFAQAAPLNVSKVASECAVERKVVEDYFGILRDLLLSIELPVFSKKSKRALITKSKFYFFDAGVFRAIRPKGPLDSDSDLGGLSLETLVVQNIRAMNDYHEGGYELSYWHTRQHDEVDLVLYGPKGLKAIEVKTSARIRNEDFKALHLFKQDYPSADLYMIYGGTERKVYQSVQMVPAKIFLPHLADFLVS